MSVGSFFHPEDPGAWIQVVGLGSKDLYLLSRLVGPVDGFLPLFKNRIQEAISWLLLNMLQLQITTTGSVVVMIVCQARQWMRVCDRVSGRTVDACVRSCVRRTVDACVTSCVRQDNRCMCVSPCFIITVSAHHSSDIGDGSCHWQEAEV